MSTSETPKAYVYSGDLLDLPKGVEEAQAGTSIQAALVPQTRGAGIGNDAYQPDARARAILRGKAHAEADLRAAGGAFSVEEVRTLLNDVTRQAIDRRVNEGALLAVPGPSGYRRFPTVQFNADGALVGGLKEVQTALCFSSPWAVLNFLVNANDQLGGSRPIDVLRQGEVSTVVSAARSIGLQGA